MSVKHLAGMLVRTIVLLVFFTFGGRHVFAQRTEAQKIDAYLKERMANSRFPGLAVTVVRHDTLILARGYGHTPDGNPINEHTSFAIASLSKAFTAAAVLQLVEADKIQLDAPVIKYLPDWMPDEPKRNTVTVRHLLNQVSGLGDRGYAEFVLPQQPYNLKGAIECMASARLVSDPGKQFNYTNPNYQVLARLVEVAGGEPFGTYIKGHLLDKLGMRTTYDVATTSAFTQDAEGIPLGNIFVFGQPVTWREPNWFIDGDAGIISNATDMAKWMSFQLGADKPDSGSILLAPSLKLMQTASQGVNSTYGMGWHVNKDAHLLYHSGIMWTYSAQEILLTDKGIGITVLFNGGPDNLTDYYSFLQGIQDVMNGEKPDTGAFPRWLYTVLIILVSLFVLAACIRRWCRVKQWHQKTTARAIWKTRLFMLLRLVPLVLLLMVPAIITLVSGRVLNWPRIVLMFPDVIIFLGLLAASNLFIIVSRLVYLYNQKR